VAAARRLFAMGRAQLTVNFAFGAAAVRLGRMLKS